MFPELTKRQLIKFIEERQLQQQNADKATQNRVLELCAFHYCYMTNITSHTERR